MIETLLLLFLTLLLCLVFFLKNSSSKNLPPGPPPFPIIGNLHQLGSKPHSTLAQLAQTYGPLFSLRFGFQLVVVASSPAAASEVLKAHDNVLSGRHITYSARLKNYVEHSMVWAPECTEAWKNLRRICRLELVSTRAMEARAGVREVKVEEMVGFLRGEEGEVVKVSEVVFGTIFNALGGLIFSKDVFDMRGEGGGVVRDLKVHLCKMMELGSAISLADCFPKLGWMTGVRRASEECRRDVYGSWEEIIRQRRESSTTGAGLGDGCDDYDDDSKKDFLSSLIKAGFSNDQINALLLDIFCAASDTTTSTIEWAMAEIMKNPHVLPKVRSEFQLILETSNKNIAEADLSHLPYLQATVKETLRLHPPTPLLLPRRALQTCKVMNYTVPKDSQILVNAWAIGRETNVWENPLKFWPERFLEDYKLGNSSFDFVPFGGGRRICPGLPLAAHLVPLILGSLVHNFDWSLPSGMNLDDLTTEENFGLTLQKDPPLLLVPKARH